jgi:hypothetical protein
MQFKTHYQQKVKILPRLKFAGKFEELKAIQLALLCLFLISKEVGGITFQHPFVCWTHTFLAAQSKGKYFLLKLSELYGTRNFITTFTGTDPCMWVWRFKSRFLHFILFFSHFRYDLPHNHSSALEFRFSNWTMLISDAIDACYASYIRIRVFHPSRLSTQWYCAPFDM